MPPTNEELQVIDWRQACLETAGYPFPQALELAARTDINLHTALKLLAAGCPAELATDILR